MSTFLAACNNETVTTVPVWFMRQAGRSLPEYRAARKSTTLLEAIQKPELAAELTVQPVRRYGVDAAIIFSDIMTPLYSIGFGVDIVPGIGPVVNQPFLGAFDLDRLRNLEPEVDSPYIAEAIRLAVAELGDTPLIGFCGAPFTLAGYLIEGGPSKSCTKTKHLMYTQPDLWHALMNRLTDIASTSLHAQIAAGCSAVQVFDSWIGILGPVDYETYVYPHMEQLFASLAPLHVPRIHFGVGTSELLSAMSRCGADVMGIDWRISLKHARERSDGKPLQGNLDPAVCLADWNVVESHAARILSEGHGCGHVFNLGHGVMPDHNPDVLKRLVDFVHEQSPSIIAAQQ